VSDSIPAERRGRAMGIVMGAFPIVAVLGVPLSLYLASHFSWRAPFLFLGVAGAALLFCCYRIVPSVRSHLDAREEEATRRIAAGGQAAGTWEMFADLFRVPNHRKALVVTALFTFSGFALFPFLSVFQVRNLGVTEQQLAIIYFAGGAATLFTSRIIGILADRYGKRRMYTIMAIIACGPMLWMTWQTDRTFWVIVLVSVLFMVTVSGRFIPLTAFLSMCVEPKVRGAFMSLSNAVQNMASGMASLMTGAFVGTAANGEMTRFGWVGLLCVTVSLTCVAIVQTLKPMSPDKPLAKPGPGA
jgi:predicted MFS family arabinose efflux permease